MSAYGIPVTLFIYFTRVDMFSSACNKTRAFLLMQRFRVPVFPTAFRQRIPGFSKFRSLQSDRTYSSIALPHKSTLTLLTTPWLICAKHVWNFPISTSTCGERSVQKTANTRRGHFGHKHIVNELGSRKENHLGDFNIRPILQTGKFVTVDTPR